MSKQATSENLDKTTVSDTPKTCDSIAVNERAQKKLTKSIKCIQYYRLSCGTRFKLVCIEPADFYTKEK